MSKGKRRQEKTIIQYSNIFSEEKMTEIQAEAYYRALKKIEEENKKNEAEEERKYKWYENIFLALNVIFMPWHINKKYKVSNRIYDGVLVLFVSGIMQLIGGGMWIIGILNLGCKIIYPLIKVKFAREMLDIAGITILLLVFGSVFVLAGSAFGKETDSNKIYAYSASVLVLVGCIISLITMLGI